MREKWIPLLLITLLIISPFSAVSEVHAMNNDQSEESQQGHDKTEEDSELVTEQDDSTNESLSEEVIFQLGDEDEVIQELKEDLTELGFAELNNPTEYFGLHTEEAVRALQQFYDIEETGIADENTLLKIEEILASDSFDREEHLEFSKPDEFEMEEEEIEHDSEAEIEGSPETDEDQKSETEESPESEENQESETEESPESEKEQESETEESPELEEEQEPETGESPESEEEQESETGESPESEENQESEIEESPESEEEQESETEESLESEENAENQEAGKPNLARVENFAAKSSYQQGDRHADIVDYKKQLNAVGFGYITETNLFGSFMETQVKRFQEYYGLSVTGKIDTATKDKLDSVYNSPFQKGKRHNDVTEIKEKLNSLGYGYISITTLFGDFMDKKVKEFQRDHGLRVNGIADEKTLAKLDELAPKDTYQRGDRHADIIEYKKQLNAVGFGYITETNLYGSFMENQVKRFQEYYGLTVTGTMNNATKIKLNSVYNTPFQKGKRHNETKEIKKKLNSLGYGYISITTLYGDFMEKKVRDFQRDNGLRVNGIVDEVTLSQINQAFDQQSSVKIFLDPGHGGSDPGGSGYGLREKDVVLDIALKTEKVLTTKYQGVEVELSRRNDTFIELTERANHANRWGAHYFVSLHNNAFNGSTRGFETFIHNGNVSQETRNRQQDIHSYLSGRLNVPDRGQKTANFSVLRNTNMPAILIEYLFIDNFTENALLKNENYRQQLAQYTADAIAQSYNLKRK